MLDKVVDSSQIFDPSVIWFVFSILIFVLFAVGFILRFLKQRAASRIVVLIASAFLVIYAGLTFIDLKGTIDRGDWTLKDVGDIIFFGTTLIIFALNLGMAIRKK